MMAMTRTRTMNRNTVLPYIRAGLAMCTAVLAASCAPADGVSDDLSPTPTDRTDTVRLESDGTGVLEHHSVMIDDLERTWSTYIPTGGAGPAAPLVVVLHGTGDTGRGIRGAIGPDLEKVADEHGFSIAYVDGHRNNWNECRLEGDWPAKARDLDDVGLVREVVRVHGSSGPVHAVGFSSGGHMAMRLAMEAPDLVEGVASVAANPPAEGNQTCDDAGGAVPIMFVQGREDPINPLEGGEVRVGSGPYAVSRGDVLSAVDGAEWFAERNGATITPAPTPERDGAVETFTWPGPEPVRLVVLDRVGHSFPTLSGRWGGDARVRYDGPGEIWRFFSGD